MKLIAIIIAISVAVLLGSLLYHAKASHNGSAPGLSDNKLSECPDKPNCVNSEYTADPNQYIAPIQVTDVEQAMSTANAVINDMGGSVTVADANYLASIFTSAIFRFIDDFEVRLDRDTGLLHLRSGARLGYSDLNKNRERAQEFAAAFQSAQPAPEPATETSD